VTEEIRPRGTYRTLAEQREVLTPAEERFEKARQTIGLFLGPIVFLIDIIGIILIVALIPVMARLVGFV
jgi:hypothetical protein